MNRSLKFDFQKDPSLVQWPTQILILLIRAGNWLGVTPSKFFSKRFPSANSMILAGCQGATSPWWAWGPAWNVPIPRSVPFVTSNNYFGVHLWNASEISEMRGIFCGSWSREDAEWWWSHVMRWTLGPWWWATNLIILCFFFMISNKSTSVWWLTCIPRCELALLHMGSHSRDIGVECNAS